MMPAPQPGQGPRVTTQEIDHRTIKLIVGVIAISLPILTDAFAPTIASISASYYAGGPAQSIFIGFLFAIAAFMLAYNGFSRTEMWMSKLAAIAALGVALFPCECAPGEKDPHSPVHLACAATMFVILVYFCGAFYRRAVSGQYPNEGKRRAAIYVICGATIVFSIGLCGYAIFSHAAGRLMFYGEFIGLVAFGVSWLVASRVVPGITHPGERFAPWRDRNPE